MKLCPRCGRHIRWIKDSTYGGNVTFYHKCLETYALVREDGTMAQNPGWNMLDVHMLSVINDNRKEWGLRPLTTADFDKRGVLIIAGEEPTVLNQLKNFQVDRLDMEELFSLSALGKTIKNEYTERQMAVPTWLVDQLQVLDREIAARRQDEIQKRLREIKAQRTGLETTEEKRLRLDREEAELQKQLGVAPVATP